jgi:hypothetical protein
MTDPIPDPAQGNFDRRGVPFDPLKFFRRFDRLGRWINARGGRKPSNPKRKTKMETNLPASSDPAQAPAADPAISTPAATPDPKPATPAADAPNFDDVRRAIAAGDVETVAAVAASPHATAETIIGIIQTVLVMIGGSEEGLLSKDEKDIIRPALVRVLDKYKVGKDALPPEVDLAVALSLIVISRIKKGGKTATFFAKVRAWAQNLWARRSGRSLAAIVDRETPSDPA